MKPIEQIVAFNAEISALRREIHAHPELRYDEHRTAELIAGKLTEWGIEVHRGLGKTGVVGVVKNGTSRRAIGLRADMDALPMTELNRFAHASRIAGRMHACGHDGHTAMLLAAARHLSKHRNFDGTVFLVFQPAEEGGAGAREMMRDGLFERFPMQAIFGMHNWPGLKPGQIAMRPGPMLASSNEFRITLRGRGTHAALPHLGIDPIPIACQLIQALQTIVSRNRNPIDAALISVTMLHAGEATNVVPDSADIRGTVRTFRPETLDMVERRMRELTEHTASAFGASAEFDFHRNYPSLINHDAETRFCREVAVDVVGADNVFEFEPAMGSEDFAFFLQQLPGCYVAIGNGSGDHRASGHGLGPCVLHGPHYDFNDEIIPIGASYWVQLAERWFQGAAEPAA